MKTLGVVRLVNDSSRGHSEGLIATTSRDWGMLLWRQFVRWLMKPIPFPGQAYDMEPPETSCNQKSDGLPQTANDDER